MRIARTFVVSITALVCLCGLWMGLPTDAMAGPPRTMPGPCGSVLPKNSRRLAKNRYHVTYHREITGILKMYRKVYGKKNSNYRTTKLLALSNVIAYHLKSFKKSTRWSGINITFYPKHTKPLQIFVICRK